MTVRSCLGHLWLRPFGSRWAFFFSGTPRPPLPPLPISLNLFSEYHDTRRFIVHRFLDLGLLTSASTSLSTPFPLLCTIEPH